MAIHNIDENRGKVIKFQVQDESGQAGGGGSGGDGGFGASGGGGSSSWGGSGAYWEGDTLILPGGKALLCDYGMSKGWYSARTAEVNRIDPKLIYVLDFPKKIANFTDDNDSEADRWDKYFFTDPIPWQQSWGSEGANWRRSQALRHFGQANVLFCDGHIEALGPAELGPLSPLWLYGRQ